MGDERLDVELTLRLPNGDLLSLGVRPYQLWWEYSVVEVVPDSITINGKPFKILVSERDSTPDSQDGNAVLD